MPYRLLQTLHGHSMAVSAVSPCGEPTVFLSAGDFSAKSWKYSPEHGYQVVSDFAGHGANITCATFIPASEPFPDGLFVTGGYDNKIMMFQPFENDVVEVFCFESAVTSLYVIDVSFLLCALEDGTVMLFKLTYYDLQRVGVETIQNYCGHKLPVWSVIHSAGYVISASEENDVLIFEKSEDIFNKIAYPIQQLNAHPEGVQTLVAINNSVEFLTAGIDGSIRRWNASTGSCLLALRLHQSLILAIAVSPDNSFLTSCAEDEIIIWHNAFTDEDFNGEFIDCPQSACSVAILPNNDIVIGSSEGEIYIYSKDKEKFKTCKNEPERRQDNDGELLICPQSASSVATLPNDEIVVGSSEAEIQIFSKAEKKNFEKVPERCEDNDGEVLICPQSASSVATLPNNDIVVGSSEGEVLNFSKAKEKTFEKEPERCKNNGEWVFIKPQSACSVLILPNNDVVIFSSEGEVFKISKAEVKSCQCEREQCEDNDGGILVCHQSASSVLILPNNDLVIGSSDGEVYIVSMIEEKTCEDVPERYGDHIKLLLDLDSESD